MKRSRLLKAFCCLTLLLAIIAGSSVTAMAMSDGAYVAGRTTSYVNPETGETYDGGSNIALGDSMCASIVDDQVLIEQVNGTIYVTVGFGMMSNISDVRIAVQSAAGGGYSNVSITQTGTVIRNGDNCNQYRFEVSSLSVLIRPTFYVEPMGRDVTFYISINTDSITTGTGDFTSVFFGSTGVSSSSSSSENDSALNSSGSGDTSGSSSESGMSVSSSNQSSSNSAAETTNQDSAAGDISAITSELGTGENNTDTAADLEDVAENSISTEATNTDVTALLADVKGLTVYQVNHSGTDEDEAASGLSASWINSVIVAIMVVVIVFAGGMILYLRRKNSKEAS